MYHPGKVLKVFSKSDKSVVAADATTQAMLLMWDENVLTLLVDAKIAGKIREGDVVIVDYRPAAGTSPPMPRQLVTKIVRGKTADVLWKEYQHVRERQKQAAASAAQRGQSYIG
ncbi:hypothetical protein J4441_05420 [Candidatus Micrarchaeota archaeon]|nr:hypothetical protein [Candidatus Micrarchaeota archaeon]